jgi:hypothetical protein
VIYNKEATINDSLLDMVTPTSSRAAVDESICFLNSFTYANTQLKDLLTYQIISQFIPCVSAPKLLRSVFIPNEFLCAFSINVVFNNIKSITFSHSCLEITTSGPCIKIRENDLLKANGYIKTNDSVIMKVAIKDTVFVVQYLLVDPLVRKFMNNDITVSNALDELRKMSNQVLENNLNLKFQKKLISWHSYCNNHNNQCTNISVSYFLATDGLQIGKLDENKNELALIDFGNNSISDFDMYIRDDNLILTSGNMTITSVLSNQLLLAFKDTILRIDPTSLSPKCNLDNILSILEERRDIALCGTQ